MQDLQAAIVVLEKQLKVAKSEIEDVLLDVIRSQEEGMEQVQPTKKIDVEKSIKDIITIERKQNLVDQVLENQSSTELTSATMINLIMLSKLLPETNRELIYEIVTEHKNLMEGVEVPEKSPVEAPISQQEIKEKVQKYQKIAKALDNQNDSGWTDDSSVKNEGDDVDDVLIVDDNIADAMEESEGSEKAKEGEQDSEEHIEELEEEFVVNGKSDHDKLLTGHKRFVVSLASDPVHNILATGSGDDTINIYDLKKLQVEGAEVAPEKTLVEQETVSILKFNFNHEQLLAVTSKYVNVYKTQSLQSKRIEMQECTSVAMHPLGNLCALTTGPQLHLYNLNNCSLYNTYYSDRDNTLVEFSPDGKAVFAGAKGQLKVIFPKNDEVKKITGHNFHEQEIVSLVCRENVILTGGVDGYACISNWLTGSALARSELHTNSVENVMFYNNMFLTGCVDGFMRWYDVNTFKKINNHQFDGAITSLIRLKQSPLVAVSTFKGQISLMDPRAPQEMKTFSAGSTIHQLCSVSKDGLAAACEDGFTKYFDIRTK